MSNGVIFVEELRGLSADLPLPGIFVRSAVRNERSLVSDLLNEGYDARSGPGPVGVCEPEPFLPSFEDVYPILSLSSFLLSDPDFFDLPKRNMYRYRLLCRVD